MPSSGKFPKAINSFLQAASYQPPSSSRYALTFWVKAPCSTIFALSRRQSGDPLRLCVYPCWQAGNRHPALPFFVFVLDSRAPGLGWLDVWLTGWLTVPSSYFPAACCLFPSTKNYKDKYLIELVQLALSRRSQILCARTRPEPG